MGFTVCAISVFLSNDDDVLALLRVGFSGIPRVARVAVEPVAITQRARKRRDRYRPSYVVVKPCKRPTKKKLRKSVVSSASATSV
jgi:hypothetical protein